MKFEPVIKWMGSKRTQSEYIVSLIEKKEYDTYYEPFCGGCSVLFQLLHSNIKFKKYICSDINKDLIALWNEIKNNPNKVIEEYEKLWNELNKDNDLNRKKEFYNKIRSEFNKTRNPNYFMFIMRTTVNGMPRYNKNNEFNNAFHITRNGIMPHKLKKIITEWSFLLNEKNVSFISQSYLNIQTNKNDLIYLDPPYAKTKGIYFGGINLEELWNWMLKQPCKYILSFDEKDTFNEKTIVPYKVYKKHKTISGHSGFKKINKNKNNKSSESIYYN